MRSERSWEKRGDKTSGTHHPTKGNKKEDELGDMGVGKLHHCRPQTVGGFKF